MRKHIFAAALLLIATFLVAVSVAEVAFPESFLTFTDKEFLIEKFPKIWKYNIHVGLASLALGILLVVPAYRKDKDFTIKGLMSEAVGREDFRVEEVHREICEFLDLYKQLFA